MIKKGKVEKVNKIIMIIMIIIEKKKKRKKSWHIGKCLLLKNEIYYFLHITGL